MLCTLHEIIRYSHTQNFFGCGFSLSVPRDHQQRAHVCLLLLLLHRRSHGAPGRAHSSPSHRAVLSLLGSFQCIGGPGLAQGIGRDHRRPHLGMRSASIGHMQQVLMTTERYLFKRGISLTTHSLATMRGRRVCYRDVPTATRMVCGKSPAVAKNAAIACGLSHRMQTQRQCHQAGFPSSVHATHHALQSVT